MGFGEITSVSGISFLASKMCGILGFGYKSISVDKLDTFMDLESTTTNKTFSMYMHSNPAKSYMMIPGWDKDANTIDTHTVSEQKYWALNLKGVAQGTKSIKVADNLMAVIDSGTSLLVGPKEIVDPLIAGITVKSDCSGLDSLPDISFTIDATTYTLSSTDYVLKVSAGG